MPISYAECMRLYKESLENKEQYWERVAEKLVFTKKWTSVFEETEEPFGKWFLGAEINLCYNCVDRHVEEGHGDRTAYIFDSPVTQTHRVYTFADTLDEVSRLAGVLVSMGIKKGDVVMIIMPMIPEGAFSMLASARVGALHACITTGLSHEDITKRIDHCKPKVILMSSHGYHASGWMNYKPDVDAACEMAVHKPNKILVLQREKQPPVTLQPGRDLNWKEEMRTAKPVGYTPIKVHDPSFLIYTSGSTGEPKAVVHAGGYFAIRFIHDGEMVLGKLEDNNIMLATVNFGWIAGAMIVTYGFLLQGSSAIVFEGDSLLAEDIELLYTTLEKHNVACVFIRPGLWKSLRGKDPQGIISTKYDLHRLKDVYLSGERTDYATMDWIRKTFKSNVWNCYAQTESASMISGAIFNDDMGNPKVHDYSVPCAGYHIKVVDDEGVETKPYEIGRIIIKTGNAPWSFVTLLNDHEGFLKKYFSAYPGYFDTMDQGSKNEEGHLRIESRTDDMMKVGLHYVTSQAIEEVVMKHKSVSECVIVSSTDLVWKEIPVTIYVKKPGSVQELAEIEKEVHDAVKDVLGKTLHLGRLIEVIELPVTRNGKLHRPSLRAMVRGDDIPGLGNVENLSVLPDVKDAILKAGYGTNVLSD